MKAASLKTKIYICIFMCVRLFLFEYVGFMASHKYRNWHALVSFWPTNFFEHFFISSSKLLYSVCFLLLLFRHWKLSLRYKCAYCLWNKSKLNGLLHIQEELWCKCAYSLWNKSKLNGYFIHRKNCGVFFEWKNALNLGRFYLPPILEVILVLTIS